MSGLPHSSRRLEKFVSRHSISAQSKVLNLTSNPSYNNSFSNCDPIRSDNIDTLVTWKGLSLLNYAKPVRASFRMQESEIYSFWTEKKK